MQKVHNNGQIRILVMISPLRLIMKLAVYIVYMCCSVEGL